MNLRRAFSGFVIALLTALAAGAALAWWWTGAIVPALAGQESLPGLLAPVEVRFDRYAIPHVSAGGVEDAWTAVGNLQARDRLWQMELYRRAASGRLSEIFGESTLAVDQRFLMLGLRRAAEAEWAGATPAVRIALERYAIGVNHAIAADGRWKLPLEFQLLRLRPEPWDPVDSLAIGKLMAWRLTANHSAELLRYALARAVGPSASQLLGDPPAWAPTILGAGKDRAAVTQDRMEEMTALSSPVPTRMTRPINPITLPVGLEWLADEAHAGSNSWVISGSRTATGRPLLANDPHLAVEMPSIWWEVHVTAADLDVAGVTIPGIPFIIIGHNRRIGWGLTNVGADVQDFYVERLDRSRKQYLSNGTWLPLKVDRYEIGVRGRPEPVRFEVLSSGHGPIADATAWQDPALGAAGSANSEISDTPLALRWESVARGESAGAFDALARAGSWTEFLAAVRRFSAPAQNFVYADVDGNIGYAMSGLIPIRASGDGAAPVPGWTLDHDWRGFVDAADLPALLNPASGQIVTANNEVDRAFPYVITRDWVAPFRAARAAEMLGDRRGLDMPAMARMQADVTSLAADAMLKSAGPAAASARAQNRPLQVIAALDHLRLWDRRVDGRAVAALYEAFEHTLWRRTFVDELGAELFGRFYRYAANERFAGLFAIIDDPASAWFDDVTTPDVRETRDDIMALAAQDAVAMLNEQFGDERAWAWDRLHAVRFSHALAAARPLDWFLSRGPVAVPGDGMTVSKTATNLRRPYATTELSSYRLVLDAGAWDESVGVNTTGQSGHARSPHYFDQNSLWRGNSYHPLPFTRRAVEAATASQLRFVP